MREKLAEHAHKQWVRWIKYLLSVGTFNPDGSWTMPAYVVVQWQQKITMEYKDLPDFEKEWDLKEADEIAEIVSRGFAETIVNKLFGRR
jgi:hypothetical protein